MKVRRSDSQTLSEKFENFLDDKRLYGISEKTLEDYRVSFRLFSCFAEQEVDKESVAAWIEDMQSRELSTHSINHHLRNLRVFSNAIGGYKIKLLPAQESIPKCYTDEQLDKLLKRPLRSALFSEWRTWAIINVIYATGMRASSVCSLRLGDIDWENGYISPKHTKNKKALVLPLSSGLCRILREYVGMWRGEEVETAYLFPSAYNKALTPNALRQALERYAKKRGVKKYTVHGLRHSFARDYIRNEGNPLKLKRILGHSTLAMTNKYVALFSEDLKKDYEKYSPLDRKLSSKERIKKKRV